MEEGRAMPWQFRKRLRIGPGVYLNIGKRNVSLSVGGPFMRTSVSTSGYVTNTVSFPGTDCGSANGRRWTGWRGGRGR